MARKSSKKRAERVVRYTRTDGTVVEKHYPAYVPPQFNPADPHTPSNELSLGDMIASYERSPDWRNLMRVSQESKQRAFARFGKLVRYPVGQITMTILLETRDYIAQAKGDGAGADFARHVTKLFSWAEERGIITMNPARKLQKGLLTGELPAWTEDDYQRAISFPEMPERIRRAIVLARWTAQRRGDLIKMDWRDVYTDPQGYEWIHVTQQKHTGRKRKQKELEVPVSRALSAELKVWRAEAKIVDRWGKPSGPILTAGRGEQWHPSNLSSQMMMYLAQIPGFPKGHNIHGLRKFALTYLANLGGSLHTVQAIGGHDTLEMVQHYTRGAEQRAGAQLARQLLDRD